SSGASGRAESIEEWRSPDCAALHPGYAQSTIQDANVSLSLRPDDKGILPDRMILGLIKTGAIIPAAALDEDQVQPASIDLRLGEVAYRVRASFLPGPDSTVAGRIDELQLAEIRLGD